MTGGVTNEYPGGNVDRDPIAVLDAVIVVTTVRARRNHLDFPWKIECGRNKIKNWKDLPPGCGRFSLKHKEQGQS